MRLVLQLHLLHIMMHCEEKPDYGITALYENTVGELVDIRHR